MIEILARYGRIYGAFFKTSLVSDLEFRANMTIRLIVDFLWYSGQVLMFETLFRHTDHLGTWNLAQVRVFMGLLFVADGLYMLFFSINMDSFSENIRLGQIDFLLVKPINSQFMVSFKKADTSKLGNLLMAVAWMIWSLSKLGDWNANRLFWLIILIPSGLVSLYAFRFFFVTLAIFFTNSANVQYIWYQFYHLGMKPDSIYRPWIRVALFVIAPVSLMANVPARALMDPFNPGLYLASVLVAAFFLYLSHRFWNFALKFHSSASS